jgi:copper(I)-binding protein
MLIDLRAPLRDGERVSLTLTFARAGTLTLDVPVRRTAPAGGPPAGHHQH